MDAWIKGIRRLRVVHYNYIEPRFAAELAEAARIMEIDIRIGIEFYTPFRGRYINLIWVPRAFPTPKPFSAFWRSRPSQPLWLMAAVLRNTSRPM